MKKTKIIFLTIITALIGLTVLTGCSKSDNEPIKSYNVTFDFGYNYKTTAVLVKDGSFVTPPVVEDRTGYKFLYWTLNGERFDCDSAPIKNDVILNAEWLKLKPVNIVINGVSTLFYIEPKDGYTLADFSEIQPEEGLELTGFYQKIDGDIVSVKLKDGINDNAVIYAEFKTKDLTISKIDGVEEMQITGLGSDTSNIVIPNFYQELPVTTIGVNAFNKKTIEEIKFNTKINTIKVGAFSQAAAMSITIPKSVVTIEENAFANSGINEIIFESGSMLTELGAKAFSNMPNLRSIRLPDKLEVLRSGTFNNCPNLTFVYIPNSVAEIHNYIFFACSKLNVIYIQEEDPSKQYVKADKWNYENDRPIEVKIVKDYSEIAKLI